MKTLRGRLTLWIVGVVAITLLVFSALLFWVIRATLISQFDDRLRDQGRALANMVEERAPGQPWELELSAFAQFDQTAGTQFHELWMDDGEVLLRSTSLQGAELQRDGTGAVMLPTGVEGRQIVLRLSARRDEEAPPIPTGRVLTIAVARDTRGLDRDLWLLLALLLTGGTGVLVAAAAASRFAIGRGLLPVVKLSTGLDAIDDKRLSDRLPLEGLPSELHPVVGKLNALLTRLDESFARERRFSADVSHELRTPIAGLRSILEVAVSRERTPSEYQVALNDALGVARQMAGLVEALLTLAQLEMRSAEPAEPVPLRPLVDHALVPLASIARARRLSITNEVPADLRLAVDPHHLQLVLNNLLTNACEHTTAGGQVAIVSDVARGIWLEVQNSGPAIPEAALPRLFERFFRADASRANTGEHHGLGLSVVRAVCDQLGAQVTVANRPDGWVTFTVRK